VYDELRNEILGGALAVGEPLIEERLAQRFGLSRTPVREALRRLEGDGYLVRGRGGSLRPAVPQIDSMAELYDVRGVLEELSVRRAATSGDHGALVGLREQWVELRQAPPEHGSRSGPDFVYADEAFHQAIAASTGNLELVRILTDLNGRIRRLRILDFTTADRIEMTITEHIEIVDAVLMGNAEAAAAFMRTHVERSALVVRERATRIHSRMSAPDGG
jgi:DNA-binding GntR family transcriptional regulator